MIKIYRFGNYINAVNNKSALEAWIRDNVPPGKQDQCTNKAFLSECYDLPALMLIAGRQNYTFKAETQTRGQHKQK